MVSIGANTYMVRRVLSLKRNPNCAKIFMMWWISRIGYAFLLQYENVHTSIMKKIQPRIMMIASSVFTIYGLKIEIF
jgi:hypothetical protein